MYKFTITLLCVLIAGAMPSLAGKKSSSGQSKSKLNSNSGRSRKDKEFAAMDLDGNGMLSEAEYLSMPKKTSMSDRDHVKKMSSLFKKRDVDGDGVVCIEEYKLNLSGSNKNVDEYLARKKAENPIASSGLMTAEAIEAKVARLVQEALEKQSYQREQADLIQKMERMGVVLYDTRITTTKTMVIGRLIEKSSDGGMLLEILPGVRANVEASDIVRVENIPLDAACNKTARQKLGI